MKIKGIVVLIVFFTGIFTVKAQNCETFIPVKVGEKLMYKMSNKKGKVQSYYSQELLSSSSKDGGTEYMILRTDYDKKKNVTGKDTLIFLCKDNVFYIDMNSYLNKEQMADYEEAQISVDFKNIGYPSNMSPGTDLDDGYVKATIDAGFPIVFKTDITNRKVEAKETVTTEAGTFNTVKISQDITSKFGFINVKMSVKSWMCKGVGEVKSETYDKNGNLFSVVELIEIKK